MSFKKIEASPFRAKIEVPSSKSFANRALVLAALKKEAVTLENIPLSSDVELMIDCLKKIGLEITQSPNRICVVNSFPECEKETQVVLETGEGGTTNRFLIPLLSLGSSEYIIEPKGHMRKRPMKPLYETLIQHGVFVESEKDHWLKIKGPFQVEESTIEVDCTQTTQFATGLALALSKLGLDVIPRGLSTSESYWKMTLDLIEKVKASNHLLIPVDFSSLGYPIAMALHCGEVTITNCHEIDEFQADSVLIEIVKKMGGTISFSKEGLIISKSQLNGLEIDCSDCPDLVATLAFLCSYAKGESLLKNIEVLKYKECDRILETMRILDAFGITHELNSSNGMSLKIQGRKSHHQYVPFTPEDDHRMVMVSYLFMRANGGGELGRIEAVEKSFSNFFDVMENH
ncbi:hypothetical protein HBN50_14860 [Halobacteriovorax sp. GB3]|uniref:3-phosphoshikimate 1-carboxyvinyltransferase n=1 Tax=Halobacteriovorax sp. GB3 TaxID=2719615 RepID=UPI0023631528|nr:hypothetical protein [Halobacteriovorax sp. GB3]MDD0854391.1 hypothetical protein [Halobacteriovorax sp. GB3]